MIKNIEQSPIFNTNNNTKNKKTVQQTTTDSISKKRYYQIDLFRFIAALSVVFYHYLFRGYMTPNMSNLHFSEIGKYFKYGYLGVDMFFIISGFVIALSIKSRRLSDFVISRISRLYPSYWLSIIITSAVIILFNSPTFTINLKQIIVNLSMFQNYLNISSIDAVYWSLFIEMKFYIFVIGTYLILNKIREIKIDYLIYFWLFITILKMFLNNSLISKLLNSLFILDYSSYFIAGIIFYQISKDGINTKYTLLLCIAAFISVFYAIARVDMLEIEYKTSFSKLYIGSFVMICYILMFLVSFDKLKFINSSKLIKLGLLTYPLYLLHQNIGFVLFNTFGNELNKYTVLFLTLILMLLASYLISFFYEPKISNYLKNKLKGFIKTNRQNTKFDHETSRSKNA